MLRRPVVIPAAIIVLAAPYVAALGFEIDGIDTQAPLLAGLSSCPPSSRTGRWSCAGRSRTSPAPTCAAWRCCRASPSLTIGAGTVVLAIVEGVEARGVAIDMVGAVAAVGAIALLALAAIRRSA